ncbi:putative lipid II flippase FtsW [Nocardioidaceae bacterium]|nr:putative lipid II flippase FtsW [Nocardioidaceae bacterium]
MAETDATTTRAPRAGRGVLAPVRTWSASTRRTLDHPLASYYLLLGSTGLLLLIGLLMVLSASSVASYRLYDTSYYYFTRQFTWVLVGLPLAWVATKLPQVLLRRLAWVGVGVTFALIVASTTGLGVEVNGNTNWVALGPVQLQPSEIAKFTMVVWAADVLARKEPLLVDWRHTLVPVVPVMLLLTAMVVVLQQDLGTGLVLFAITLGVLWVAGAPGKLFAIAMGTGAAAAMTLVATDLERMERLTTFVDPFKDFEGGGWQAAHGLFAMSSGGWFGKGISASQQKWGTLPEAHTDFIFAVLGEELGLVGTLLVLGLFGLIAFAAVRLAVTTADPFVRYLTSGVMIWLLAQMMINVAMVLTLLPVIGIPLPLVSYGGSALVPTLVALGLLVGFARREPRARAALALKRAARTERLRELRRQRGEARHQVSTQGPTQPHAGHAQEEPVGAGR